MCDWHLNQIFICLMNGKLMSAVSLLFILNLSCNLDDCMPINILSLGFCLLLIKQFYLLIRNHNLIQYNHFHSVFHLSHRCNLLLLLILYVAREKNRSGAISSRSIQKWFNLIFNVYQQQNKKSWNSLCKDTLMDTS